MAKEEKATPEVDNTKEVDKKISKIVTPDFRKLVKDYFDFDLSENYQPKLRKLEFAVIGSYNEIGNIDINYRYKKHIKVSGKNLMIGESFWGLKDFKKTTSGKLFEWAKNPLEISMISEGFSVKNLVVDVNRHNTQATQDMQTFLKDSSYDGTFRLFGFNIWENLDEKNISLVWITYSIYTPAENDEADSGVSEFKRGDYVINL
jgi:hypothetical protein